MSLVETVRLLLPMGTAGAGSVADRLEAALPRFYLLLAVPMVLFFGLRVPPIRLVPDEANHLKRIEQLTRLELVGTRLDSRNSGGAVETAVVRLEALLGSVDQPASLALEQASLVDWSGRTEPASFPNTVQYGPLGYLPQVLSLGAAKAVGLGPLDSVRCARLFTGLCSLVLGFAALSFARRGRAVLFSLLTMPMTFFLAGSLSQDAVLLPAAAFLLAWITRVRRGDEGAQTRGWGFWMPAAGLLVLVGMARPPWLALGLALLAACPGGGWKPLRRVMAVLFGSGLIVLGWLWLVRPLQVEWRPGTSPPAQLVFLLAHPVQIPTIVLGSLRGPGWHYLVGDVVGVFGAVQAGLPHGIQALAFLGLGAAVLVDASRERIGGLARLGFGLAAGAGLVLLYLAMYLTWTSVGQLSIEGMQGRYVVPLYAAGSLALQGLLRPGRWRFAALLVSMLAPLACGAASVSKILQLCPP